MSARIICDSISEDSPRLTTFHVRFPTRIIQERNRHRVFSLSDRSTRAVPTQTYIDEILLDPAMPPEFRSKTKGMGGGELLIGDALRRAQLRWIVDAKIMTNTALEALEDGEGKETINARLAPFTYTYSVITSCEPGLMNFFGLRLDKHTRPEIRILAEEMWAVWNESRPKKLKLGEWHLPFCDDVQGKECTEEDDAKKVSAARCAHQSYGSDLISIERALKLYDTLVNSRPMHLSPLEHQATPDIIIDPAEGDEYWEHGDKHGNLPGWIQFRKTIPDESCAPLPQEYITE